jgi:sugar phosphate isomerase/epimerase
MSESHAMSRRMILKRSLAGGIAVTLLADGSPAEAVGTQPQATQAGALRLGGPIFEKYQDPQGWVSLLRKLGYSAAYCPVGPEATDEVVRAYEEEAAKAGIVIAEVGAWSNPISPDDQTRKAALDKCRTHLALADRIGARCCVNIAGSRGPVWDGPDPANFTKQTFDMIVETTRTIIDAVKPMRTYFALETMPWIYPDSPDSYLELLKAIDRPRFAVHLDPVNLVCSPQRYYANGALIRECFAKLGPHIRSCHAKDIILRPQYTTHLDEVRPGTGGLDYATFLKELSKLPDQAAGYIRGVAKQVGLSFA